MFVFTNRHRTTVAGLDVINIKNVKIGVHVHVHVAKPKV